MLSRAIRIAIAVVVILLLLYAVWQVSAWWQGRKQSSRLKTGEVRRHSPQLVEVSPTVVDKIDYQALVNREAAEEIADLHQEIEWYAEYSAELERRLAEGEGQVTPPGGAMRATRLPGARSGATDRPGPMARPPLTP